MSAEKNKAFEEVKQAPVTAPAAPKEEEAGNRPGVKSWKTRLEELKKKKEMAKEQAQRAAENPDETALKEAAADVFAPQKIITKDSEGKVVV